MLPGKTYNVDEVFRIAKKRIWVLLVPLAIVSAGTAVIARKIPDTYLAYTSILVVPQRIPENYVKSTVTMRIEDRLQAIKQQILSRTLLEETIKTFNLYAKERKDGELMEDLVSRMRGEVKIETVRLGEAFTINYIGEDPRIVMRVTEFLTASFINQSLKDRSSLAEGTSKFIERELEGARRRLLDQEKLLQDYNQRHSGELPTQQPANQQAVSNIQLQIRTEEAQISNYQDRRRLVQKQLQSIQIMSELFAPTLDPPVTQNIPLTPTTAAGRLAAERARLAGFLAQKYTDDHPDVRNSKRLILQLEKEADAEALRQPLTTPNKTKPITAAQFAQQQQIETLQDELATLDKQIAARQAELVKLHELSAMYQYRVDMAPTRASELVELTRDYATLQGIYQSLLSKNEESKTAANVEALQIGEQFRLLDPARMPEKPVRPNRPMINFMGIAAGFGVGLALIGLLEYRDTSFKTDDEVSTILTLPVLAVVPLMQSDEDRGRERRRRLVMGVGFGSTVLGCLAVLVYTFVR